MSLSYDITESISARIDRVSLRIQLRRAGIPQNSGSWLDYERAKAAVRRWRDDVYAGSEPVPSYEWCLGVVTEYVGV